MHESGCARSPRSEQDVASRTQLSGLLCELLVVVCLLSARASAQSIFTVAGGGTDDGRPATLAALAQAEGIAVDKEGNLFVVDWQHARIRRIAAATGIIETVAGNGSIGFSGDGGPAVSATLKLPEGIAIDASGNLFIADWGNHCIRRVDATTGVISTVGGRDQSTGGFEGDGGPASSALFFLPRNLTFDSKGNLYVVDAGNHRIRKVDSSPQHIITTVAGDGTCGSKGDGGLATMASLNFGGPNCGGGPVPICVGIVVDSKGNIFISDPFEQRVRKIAASTGVIATIAGTGEAGIDGDGGPATRANLDRPQGLALSAADDLYIGGSPIRRVDGATSVISSMAPHDGRGLTIGLDGFLLVTQYAKVCKLDLATAAIETIAGNGLTLVSDEPGPATAAIVPAPTGLALDREGNLYVAESGSSRVRRVITATATIETVAGAGVDAPYVDGDGGPATKSSVVAPEGLAFDTSGNLYIAEVQMHRVRRVDARSGIISTVAGNGRRGFHGDGGPATAAMLANPTGLAVDVSGGLFIADSANNRVRYVSPTTGVINTIAGDGAARSSGDGGPATTASLDDPEGIAIDSLGNLLIAEKVGRRVRRVSASNGMIATVAGPGPDTCCDSGDGGPATAASLGGPLGVASDAIGNLYFSDSRNVIRKVSTAGTIFTIAGSPLTTRSFGDGGAASSAGLTLPHTIVVSAGGGLYIADYGADRVRKIPACVNVGTIELASPADGSSGVKNPKLEWRTVPGAYRYDLYLSVASPPDKLFEAEITTSSFSPSNLEPLTTYFWQVVAKGDPFCMPASSSISNVWSFTTAATCTAPGTFEATLQPQYRAAGSKE